MKREYLSRFNAVGPVDGAVFEALVARADITFPVDYLNFMREFNGGEGFIGYSYVILWRLEDLAKTNRDNNVNEYVPGLYLFGSDGGGEAFAFDVRVSSAPIVRVPFVMEPSAILSVAPTFEGFLDSLYSGDWLEDVQAN